MRYLLALISAVSIAACSGDAATGPATVPGTWVLSRVNGNRLPFIASQNGPTVKSEIVSGSLTFGEGGSCTLELVYRYTDASGVTSSRANTTPGVYIVKSPEVVELNITQAPAFIEVPVPGVTATIGGNSLSYANGATFVFLKR